MHCLQLACAHKQSFMFPELRSLQEWHSNCTVAIASHAALLLHQTLQHASRKPLVEYWQKVPSILVSTSLTR